MDRLILVDKPEGPTSHDIVDDLRGLVGTRRVGHCGTLDPMATGLLLVLTGRATRLAELFSGHDKTYRATVTFGQATDTDDRTGSIIARADDISLDSKELDKALATLASAPEQRVPAFSAVKVGGVPLYRLAREGKKVEAPSRPVTIHRLDLLAARETEVDLEVHCSAGTYIRSLARDLGQLLGLPAHLSSLRRLSSGPFLVEDAADRDALLAAGPDPLPGMPIAAGLAFMPAARASSDYLPRARNGEQPTEGDLELDGDLPSAGSWMRLLAPDGQMLGLLRCEQDGEQSVARLRRVFRD